jgi:hypothetical protein
MLRVGLFYFFLQKSKKNMKQQIKDQYYLTQDSPSGQPGFEVFHSDVYHAWFFHCNDVEGRPVLFSQAYTQAEKAEKGLEAVLKSIVRRAVLSKQPEGWQIVVTAGNQQEVARSAVFETSNSGEQALQYLRQVARSKNPVTIASEPAASTGPELIEPSLRYAFGVYFYMDEAGTLTGRIENKTNQQQSRSFDGWDMDVIGAFLQEHIPETAVKIPKKNNPGAAPKKDNSGMPAPADTQTGILTLSGMPATRTSTFCLYTQGSDLSATLHAVDNAPTTHETLIGTSLTLSGSGIEMPMQVSAAAWDNTQRQAVMAVKSGQAFASGMYTLQAAAWINRPEGMRLLTGNAWLYIV